MTMDRYHAEIDCRHGSLRAEHQVGPNLTKRIFRLRSTAAMEVYGPSIELDLSLPNVSSGLNFTVANVTDTNMVQNNDTTEEFNKQRHSNPAIGNSSNLTGSCLKYNCIDVF
ncbi:hypothetical protein MAR_006351 [Mya arenaria]|uniref:Uncharacterized protein n=1 Tax=Mya arenaria TaxID=6604 RepID=A0ABY7DBZ3_MYAAR|nr:hypothetical protein MAR_006351 [Mya arenaria]